MYTSSSKAYIVQDGQMAQELLIKSHASYIHVFFTPSSTQEIFKIDRIYIFKVSKPNGRTHQAYSTCDCSADSYPRGLAATTIRT